MAKVVFSAKNISKSFPGVQALSDVSIDINESEVHSIIGENGAGKSTLMKIIFGMQGADSGKLYAYGKEVELHSPIDAQEIGLGIVPQELNLVPFLSIQENIFLGSQPVKDIPFIIDKKSLAKRTREVLSTLGLSLDPEILVKDLSAAHQQLIQVARAIAFGARILIFDEPTASLTLKETEKLFKIINNFKASGGSVFYISHRLDEILTFSDRISVFRDGYFVTELDPKTTNKDEMVNAMVGRKVDQSFEKRNFDSTNTDVVLEVNDLSRKGEFYNISFKLHKGEILGFSGLVGAGRTELAMCIFGHTKADHGTITINNETINAKHTSDIIRRRLAYVPEERRKQGIFSILSVKKNMTMPLIKKLSGRFKINRKKETTLVEKYIDKLHIKLSSMDQQIQYLSGGNQQKVILSRWMASKSEIIILDEPTRGIDVNAKNEIHELLRALAYDGKSVIVISSELEEIINLSDRVIIMHEGHIKGEVKASITNQEEIMNIALSKNSEIREGI